MNVQWDFPITVVQMQRVQIHRVATLALAILDILAMASNVTVALIYLLSIFSSY